jgi:hypothetical protein
VSVVGARTWSTIGTAALLAVVLGACGDDRTRSGDTAPAPTSAATTLAPMTTTPGSGDATTPRTFTVGTAPAGSVPTELAPAVEVAVADLAQRLDVDPSAIVAVSARSVTWPNAGIGCEQPGMAYIQVPVDGGEIILQAAGITYRYTMGGSRGPTLCTNPTG